MDDGTVAEEHQVMEDGEVGDSLATNTGWYDLYNGGLILINSD